MRQYLALLRKILDEGHWKQQRAKQAGTLASLRTKALFGLQTRYDLKNDSLYVQDTHRQWYRAELMAPCHDLDFAEAIVDLATPWLATHPRVEPITTEQYPTPAQRPMNSVLGCAKIRETFEISSSPWRRSLATVIHEMVDRRSPPDNAMVATRPLE